MFPSFVFSFVSKISVYIFHFSIFPKTTYSFFFWFFEFRLESCLKTSQVFPKIIYSIFFVSEFCLQFCFENFSLYFSFFYFSQNNLFFFFWFFEFRLESCLKTSQVFPKIIYSIFFVSEFCLQFCFENFSLYFSFFYFSQNNLFFFLIFWVSPWILFENVTGISQNNLFYLFCFRVLSSVLFRKFQSIFFIFLFFPKHLILFFLIFWVSPWILFEDVTGISQNNLFYLFCFRVLSSVLFRKFQSIFFIFLFFPKQLIHFFWFFEFRLESCLKTSQVFPKIIYSIFFVSEFCLQFCFENFSLYFSFFYFSQNNLFFFFWFFEFRLESCLKTSQVFPKIIYSIFFVSEFCLQFCFENFSLYFSFFYFSQNNLFFFFDFLSFALNLAWRRHRYFPK